VLKGHSIRWLVARHRLVRPVAGIRLAGTGLLLAAPQILAQRPRQALVARGKLDLLLAGEAAGIGHRRDGKGDMRHCQSPSAICADQRRRDHWSTRRLTLAARITATACRAAYSAA